MKRLNDFLKRLHAWPEEARRASALILFFISAAVLFTLWRANISSSLALPPGPEATAQKIDYYSETPEFPTPLAGISETLLSVRNIFPGIALDRKSLQAGVWQTFYDLGKAIDTSLVKKLWPI